MADKGECVKVVVRVRPLSRKEKQDGHEANTKADESRGTIIVENPKGDDGEPPKSFTFDFVFGADTQQKGLYDKAAAPAVNAVLQGFNATVFAYGQTGAGKTHTMEGYPDPPELRGIIPNSFAHIFEEVAKADENTQYLVRASYLEIYNEEIRDLLAKDPKNRLDLKENVDSGVYVKELTSCGVKSTHEIDQVMQAGKKNRSVGSTLMNPTSSRSHSIFTIVVETCVVSTTGEHIRVASSTSSTSRARSASQDGRDRRPAQGGDQDQPEPLGARQRHLGARRRQVAAHPVPRLQAHRLLQARWAPARGARARESEGGEGAGSGGGANGEPLARADTLAPRAARRTRSAQHQDGHVRELRAGGVQLRRDALDAAVREPREEHPQQAQDQRGPEGRDAARVQEEIRGSRRRSRAARAAAAAAAAGTARPRRRRPCGRRSSRSRRRSSSRR